MSDARLSTPVAVLVAGGMLSVAVFLGLRSQGAGTSGVASSASTVASAASPASPSTAVGPGVAPADSAPAVAAVPPTASGEVAKQVSAALEAQRPKLVSACLKSTSGAPQEVARWSFNYTFGPDGKQVARGVREARRGGSPELTTCVLATLEPLTIAPPGAAIAVEVPFQLP